MAGLTDQAGGDHPFSAQIKDARASWQESMLRRLDELRQAVLAHDPIQLAARCGASFNESQLSFAYWGAHVHITWPALTAESDQGHALSTFDHAMLLYYLSQADGTPQADRWIAFRELPDGAFYHQAFTGYSGNQLAAAFGSRPDDFTTAAQAMHGIRLTAFAEHAFAFQALPRIRLAAALYPGDEDFPAKAAVLFDAAASHYMVTDGLALLGAGLARRLQKLDPQAR